MTEFETAALVVASLLAAVLFASIITSDRTWEAFEAWLGGLRNRRPATTPKPVAPTTDVVRPARNVAVAKRVLTNGVKPFVSDPWVSLNKLALEVNWMRPNKEGIRAARKMRRQRVKENRDARRRHGY